MTGPWTLLRSSLRAMGFLGLAGIAGCPTTETPASADPIELALVRVEPADGESAVPRNRAVRMTFNTIPLPESVDDQSILVRTGGTFRTRPEGTFLVNGNIIEFDPTVSQSGGPNAIGFPAGSQILVEIPLFTPGSNEPGNQFLQNIEGNPITIASGDNEITFTTGSGWVDTVPGPPGVIGLEFIPAPNAVGQVASRAAVTVIFSEPIDPSTVVLSKNIFLTNNSDTSPIFQQDIPSVTFFDGSLTRYTFLPVFGFGQGPFNIKVNFIDPDNPSSFSPDRLPADLVGNRIQNFTFITTFDTQFDPTSVNTGLIREDFTTFTNRDNANTDAFWGDDASLPFNLVSQPITTRVANVNVAAIMNISQGTTVIPATPPGFGTTPIENRYCPYLNPLIGVGVAVIAGNPPTSSGRRTMNLYRAAELGGGGTVTRVAWGPDSDALFAATYPDLIVRIGHKRTDTSFSTGSFFAEFDVDNFVVVADVKDYKVPQKADVNGGVINNGYFNYPSVENFFDYNGIDDLILDVESSEGTTWQQIRTFMAFDNPFGICNCFNFNGCSPNTSIGLRLHDGIFGGDDDDPPPIQGTSTNPSPFVQIMQFELAKLRSQGQSKFRNTLSADPDYLTPIISPIVQPGGATAQVLFSASVDGIVEDVPFTSNINACDGRQYIRFRALLRSNLFTGVRARIALIEIPFIFP